MFNPNFNRRDAVKSLLAISAASALSACGDKPSAPAAKASLKYAREGQFFTPAEMALASAMMDTIIPQTETGGAIAAGVPATVQGLASQWGNDDYRRYWRAGLTALAETFVKSGGQNFAAMGAKAREALLSKYDADVFGGVINDPFYKDFKNTVATAYYMSEIGASEELAYEPVPGEWKGCVPLADYPKTWAT